MTILYIKIKNRQTPKLNSSFKHNINSILNHLLYIWIPPKAIFLLPFNFPLLPDPHHLRSVRNVKPAKWPVLNSNVSSNEASSADWRTPSKPTVLSNFLHGRNPVAFLPTHPSSTTEKAKINPHFRGVLFLTLFPLWSSSCLLESVFLTFNHSRITSQESERC